MITLIIIKNEDNYFRFSSDKYELCGLSKGTVYPISRLQEAKEQRDRMLAEGFNNAQLMKLTIDEELYKE